MLPGSGREQLERALNLISQATNEASLVLGKDLVFACDVAASELYNSQRHAYNLARFQSGQEWMSAEQLVDWYAQLVEQWPFISIEDALDQDDWSGWKQATTRLGSKVRLVGDDLFVTNVARIGRGVRHGIANSVLIKPNQIGTVTATFAAIKKAQENNYSVVISHRSGETSDSFIADLAVGVGADFIKLGAPSRGERIEKYNRLLMISEELEATGLLS